MFKLSATFELDFKSRIKNNAFPRFLSLFLPLFLIYTVTVIAGKFACTAFSHKAQSFLPTTKFGYRYPAILRNSTRRACFLNSSQTRETIPYDSPTINLEETSRRRFLERMTSRVAKYKSSVVYEGKFLDL